jgi:hypothetical protein
MQAGWSRRLTVLAKLLPESLRNKSPLVNYKDYKEAAVIKHKFRAFSLGKVVFPNG